MSTHELISNDHTLIDKVWFALLKKYDSQLGITEVVRDINLPSTQIIKNTFMEKEFNKDPSAFHLYGLDDYLELMVKVIEKLNPAFVIERIAGEVPPWYLAGPSWGLLRVADVVRAFESKLKDHDTWQGRLYKKLPIQEIV